MPLFITGGLASLLVTWKGGITVTGYSHPKCYLGFTSDCATQISGEHIISNGLLKLFEKDNTVKIAGLRWIEAQKSKLVGRNALKPNILCKKHNSGLHELDTEILGFFGAVQQIEEALKHPEQISHYLEFSFDGHKIERWLIKVSCGLISSNQLSNVDHITVKPECYDYLVNGTALPEDWGLYFSGQDRQFDASIELGVRHANNELLAVDIAVHNFVHAHMVLGNPGNPAAFGTFRPHNLVFKNINSRSEHNTELNWTVNRGNLAVFYTRIGNTDAPPPNREAWMNA